MPFQVPESRFDRDSGESEEGEEEAGEGTPQSSALTEGDCVPDSPALSPIELKQELPKYLPALQVRRLPARDWLCFRARAASRQRCHLRAWACAVNVAAGSAATVQPCPAVLVGGWLLRPPAGRMDRGGQPGGWLALWSLLQVA